MRTDPLISVIIPCYNQGNYLEEALASIEQQAYPALEIVVVDDGSTDATWSVVERYPSVSYVYQPNQGLAAARNTGIRHSTGQYLVFLDADDWLLPGALSINAEYLQSTPALAFVSGGHVKVYTEHGYSQEHTREVTANHYVHLLEGNYISMIAAVMYQRWVFERFTYDPTLAACEDYDLFLRVARTYPVAHHTHCLAAYRIHGTNMSHNPLLMLASALTTLERQQPYLRTMEERRAVTRGQKYWKEYYGNALYQQMRAVSSWPSRPKLVALLTLKPTFFVRYLLHLSPSMLKQLLRKFTPQAGIRLLHQFGVLSSHVPPVGQVRFGDFARTTPMSTNFGYDRGGPLDRYYIEGFLAQEAATIRGRVLEIGDNAYTLRFGEGVTQSDILHVDSRNPNATWVGNLSHAPHIPDNIFDCIILTQTLHFIYDYKQALATCYRILKPGGTLLLTVPGITPIDHGEWRDTWYWSFTDRALHRLFNEIFQTKSLTITSAGNVFIASAFLYGLGITEVTRAQLDVCDPHFQVINTVKAIKL